MTVQKKEYSDRTYNSKNYLARFAHRQRFKNSIASVKVPPGAAILDYGCGDGKFLNTLQERFYSQEWKLFGYEPIMPSIRENQVTISNDLKQIFSFSEKEGKFDLITCFEVLEHFNAPEQEEILKNIKSLLAPNGQVIISVPIEIGFPALIKNIRRSTTHPGTIYTFGNIIKSTLGIHLPEFRRGPGYLSHMGFNHKHLEKVMINNFVIHKRIYSPFRPFGSNFNSQVFYILALK